MIEEPLKNGRYITNYPGGQIRMIENYTAGMKNGPNLNITQMGELEQNATFLKINYTVVQLVSIQMDK